MFYTSTVSSVLTFGSACWGGNAVKQDKDRLKKPIRKAEGIVGRKQENSLSVYHRRLTDRLNTVSADETHPLRKSTVDGSTEVADLGFRVLERLDTKIPLFHPLFKLLTNW